MIKKELIQNEYIKILFLNFAKSEGLNKGQVSQIVEANYTELKPKTEKMSRFSEILQESSDGYSLNDLKIFHNEETIKDFTAMLKRKDLTIDEAVALKKYCEDSKIILKCSRNLSLDEEYTQIVNNGIQHLQENNFSNEDIERCLNYVLNLDYFLPLYKNYELTKKIF